MWNRVLALGLLGWALAGRSIPAEAQKVKSAPFTYLPEQGPDRYDMRVPAKTLPLADGTGFVVLAHQSAGGYAVERYDADLKKQWSTTIPVSPGETLEAFAGSTKTSISASLIHSLRDLGQSHARAWLAKHYHALGVQCTVNIKQDYLVDLRVPVHANP